MGKFNMDKSEIVEILSRSVSMGYAIRMLNDHDRSLLAEHSLDYIRNDVEPNLPYPLDVIFELTRDDIDKIKDISKIKEISE